MSAPLTMKQPQGEYLTLSSSHMDFSLLALFSSQSALSYSWSPSNPCWLCWTFVSNLWSPGPSLSLSHLLSCIFWYIGSSSVSIFSLFNFLFSRASFLTRAGWLKEAVSVDSDPYEANPSIFSPSIPVLGSFHPSSTPFPTQRWNLSFSSGHSLVFYWIWKANRFLGSVWRSFAVGTQADSGYFSNWRGSFDWSGIPSNFYSRLLSVH